MIEIIDGAFSCTQEELMQKINEFNKGKTIKAKYTVGQISQEFEFNSMDELLEYEKKSNSNVKFYFGDTEEECLSKKSIDDDYWGKTNFSSVGGGMIFKSTRSWADCDEQRKRYEDSFEKASCDENPPTRDQSVDEWLKVGQLQATARSIKLQMAGMEIPREARGFLDVLIEESLDIM